MIRRRLGFDFYKQDTVDVARRLIGQVLVHRTPEGKERAGLIVETEAYLGVVDPAAHSFGGRRTPRTEVMFGRPGLSYVYFIYGMYFCFNVVTAPEGVPEAVLVRALEPLGEWTSDPLAARGPGKLCRALGLERRHNNLDLVTSDCLWIEDRGRAVGEERIVDAPRVGIGHVGDHIFWPLRFGLAGHGALSRPKFMTPE